MKAVIVVPARWASTRFPGKPLVLIAGVSLIERVYRRAAASRLATLACPLETDEEHASPDVVKVVTDRSGVALYFSRAPIGSRQTAMRHIGVYAYARAALERFVAFPPSPLERAESLEQLRALQQ